MSSLLIVTVFLPIDLLSVGRCCLVIPSWQAGLVTGGLTVWIPAWKDCNRTPNSSDNRAGVLRHTLSHWIIIMILIIIIIIIIGCVVIVAVVFIIRIIVVIITIYLLKKICHSSNLILHDPFHHNLPRTSRPMLGVFYCSWVSHCPKTWVVYLNRSTVSGNNDKSKTSNLVNIWRVGNALMSLLSEQQRDLFNQMSLLKQK